MLPAAFFMQPYRDAAGIGEDRKGWLFRTSPGHNANALTDRPMNQYAAWLVIRRRAVRAGITAPIGNHTFRATGITVYLANGGALEHAQEMAAHDVINRKMGDPRAGKCHFENYLAQDFESYLAPRGTDADVPARSAFMSDNQGVRSRGRSGIPGRSEGVRGSPR